ncbi:aldo/keto reductase [Antarctobacter sp.]|uniref:aldo/keto reductase n=1 Tax=Antarctobacter sp. TaxID=1872577 RepID=UPI002B274199|nr:aldo/keto reductase [Antarctobacter sp.]
MLRRALGKGGPEVSALGIGAMSFAGFYGAVSVEGSHAVLDAALDAGVDHIDTANVYGMGKSEEIIGGFLKRYAGKGGLPFRIATKASITRDPDTGARCFDNSAAHLESELDRSLKRLGLERVDLFYVHRRDPRFEIEEVTQTLARLVQKGKIGAFGFSEIAPSSLRRAAAVHPVAAVQSEYSLQTRQPEMGLIQACEELGTALVAFSPVGRGLLSDTPPTPERVEAAAFLKVNPRFTGYNLERNIEASQPLRDLAAEAGYPTATLAIAWVLSQGRTMHAIPGTRSPGHLHELVRGACMMLGDDLKGVIEARLPVGWAHGARYSPDQSIGPEDYC